MKRVVLFLWVAAARSATLDVGAGQTYATIQAAADAAVAGDTVYVHDGTYAGFRLVSTHVSGTALAPITFLAESSSAQITTPNSDGTGVGVNLVDYVVINGFTITGMTTYGIFVVECDGCQILNNTVSASGSSNILTGFAYGVLIQGNTTFSAGGGQHGIYVSNSARPLDAPVIRGNLSYSNSGAGVQFNGDCFTRDHLGATDGMISGALVEGNILHDNAGSAFSIINASDSIFRNNLTYNTITVASYKLADEGCGYGSNRNVIVNNTMAQGATGTIAGVRLISGVGNVVFNNIIVTGSFDCVWDGDASTCTDGGHGNYYRVGLKKTLTQAASGIFTDWAGHNFSLTSGSLALAVGSASFHSDLAPPIDILGNVRPVGGLYDLGAYQYNSTAAAADSGAPTAPGTPSTSSVTPYHVTFSWAASTDDREVLWYYVYRDGTVTGFSGSASFTDSSPVPGSAYTYTVAAIDGVGNLSTASSGVAVSVPGSPGCLNADATWRNRVLPTQTGTFTFSADATPYVTLTNDGVIGIGPGVPAGYTDFGVIVSFGPSGNIQARHGGTYAADVTLPFSLGTAYHLRIPVSLATHTYSVYVTPAGAGEQLLAADYAFRTEQQAVTSLGYAGIFDDQGSLAACNIAVSGTLLDGMTFATVTPATSSTARVVEVGGTGRLMMDRPAVVNHAETSLTLTEAMAGNQMLRFTSGSNITVTVPAGLPTGLWFTLLQAGNGAIRAFAGSGVTLIQRQGKLRTAGRGAPLTIQSTGVANEYVVWGDLQ